MTDPSDILTAIRAVGGDAPDLPFWEACAEGQFLVHRCGVCGRTYWPASRCVDHGDANMSWVEASGRGTLYTYTVMHHAYTPAMRGATPYVVAVVRLEEGPFFHTNLVGCAPDEVVVDMPLEVVIEPKAEGLSLPMFRKTPASGVETTVDTDDLAGDLRGPWTA